MAEWPTAELSSSRDRRPAGIHAVWRRVSNFPTHGAFIPRSEANDFGFQDSRDGTQYA